MSRLDTIWENWPTAPGPDKKPPRLAEGTMLNLTSYEIEDCKRIMLEFADDFRLQVEPVTNSTERQEVQRAVERLFAVLNIHGAN